MSSVDIVLPYLGDKWAFNRGRLQHSLDKSCSKLLNPRNKSVAKASFLQLCCAKIMLGMLFLYKLRAFENVVEWLPVFIIHAVALVALGKAGTCVLLCVPYTIGKFRAVKTMKRCEMLLFFVCPDFKKQPELT